MTFYRILKQLNILFYKNGISVYSLIKRLSLEIKIIYFKNKIREIKCFKNYFKEVVMKMKNKDYQIEPQPLKI